MNVLFYYIDYYNCILAKVPSVARGIKKIEFKKDPSFLKIDFETKIFKSDLHISCLQEAMEKLSEFNTFRVRKTTLSSTFLMRSRVQGYHGKSLLGGSLEIRFQSLCTWNFLETNYSD